MEFIATDLSEAQTLSDLFNKITDQLKMGYCKSPFYDGALKKDTLDHLDDVVELNKNGMWTIDSQISIEFPHHESSDPEYKGNIQKKVQRAYLSAFIPRKYVVKFAQEMSKRGKFVGVYDGISEQSQLYIDGIPQKWSRGDDFIVTYNIWYDKYGNPSIRPYKHIYDYGSELDELKGYFKNKELEKDFLEQFIEISVVESNFYTNKSLFKECSEIMKKLI